MTEKVLVLGGSYFVGKKIVEYLAEKEYEVTVLNRGTKPVSAKNISQLICDRNDAAAMKQVLAGKTFDYVIDVSWQDVSWVKHLCDALNYDPVKKLIFIRSSAVYDVEKLSVPLKEAHIQFPLQCESHAHRHAFFPRIRKHREYWFPL